MELKRLDQFTWEIPRHGDMQVPAIIYSSSSLIEGIKRDQTLQQVKNVACLPGIQRASYAMPDAHQGYGFPIGGVAAFERDAGIISPGGVGYDINCGVRLLKTDFSETDILKVRSDLLKKIFQEVPAGVGKGGRTQLTEQTLREVCARGSEWAVDRGYGSKRDLDRTEEHGRMAAADPSFLSQKAVDRGVPQLGTLGSGNHFLEIQKVDQIFDPAVALIFGIRERGQILVMIHCGSRGWAIRSPRTIFA